MIIIQGWYSIEYGWEDVVEAEDEAEAQELLREYEEAHPGFAHRIKRV